MTEGLQYVYVKDIKPSQKNLNVIFIVLEVGKLQLFSRTENLNIPDVHFGIPHNKNLIF